MPEQPLISVVIPVYNGANSIGRAVASVLEQSLTNFEIIVVDDGSTDSTREALQPFVPHLRLLEQTNAGPAAARNAGIAIARGEYIAFLDSDDAWLPDKLQLLVDAIERNPAAVLAFSDVIPTDDHGLPLADSLIGSRFAHAPSMEEMLACWWPIYPSAVLIKRATVTTCGGFDEGFDRPGYEDPLLWLKARQLGEFAYVDRPLTCYRHLREQERMAKYAPGVLVFADRVRRHFGDAGEVLIRGLFDAHVGILSNAGLAAMAEGDMRRAREAFRSVLVYYPRHTRTLLRIARTLLPLPLVNALSSKRRRARWATQRAQSVALNGEI
ncbi:MAG TPA: glycosyltransferase [Candidatus Binataceae bacterium]|nr:glycosyltransferase [Candidatus Binataceae bacterium]